MYNTKDSIGVWRQGDGYQFITGSQCKITLEERPQYCNRGRYLAKLFVNQGSEIELYIDYADGWNPGRYYFDEERAKLEIEAWLEFRGQIEPGQIKPGVNWKSFSSKAEDSSKLFNIQYELDTEKE